jgi:hypothetical protein
MPVLARLQFCLIAMYFEDHNPPHFHILANDGREAQVGLGTFEVLHGEVDRRALAEARRWARDNEAFLRETWDEFSGR